MAKPTKVYVVLVKTYIYDGVCTFKPHPDHQAFVNREDAEELAASLQHPGCPVETDILELAIVRNLPYSSKVKHNYVNVGDGKWKDRDGEVWKLNQSIPGNNPVMRDRHLLAIINWTHKKWHDPRAHKTYHKRTMGEYMGYAEPNGEMAQLAYEQELDYWLEPWDGQYYDIKDVFDSLQIPYRELVAEAQSRGLNVPPSPTPTNRPEMLQDRC